MDVSEQFPPPAAADEQSAPPGDALRRLAEAELKQKAQVLFDLIDEHPEGRLVLPKQRQQSAELANVNLTVESLGPYLDSERASEAPWWNGEQNAVCLRGADLRGAMLRGAVLRGVDLREADLRGAVLGGADLRGALLENADLREADLVSARLGEAQLGGANLGGALLETAQMEDIFLRFAHLQYCALDQANLRGADLWGADLEGASLTQADLRRALLHEANLQDANLRDTNLREADLRDAVLREADLSEADLREADLEGTQLQRAILQRARLQSLDLTRCNLEHAYLGEAQLGQTRIDRRQLGDVIGEELNGEYEAASYGYLVLEQNFGNLGDPDAARWAYVKKRTMQKLEARQRARHAAERRDWGGAGRQCLAYLQAKLAEQTCGYGESIPRTLGSIFLVYLAFTLLYGLTGSVVRAGEAGEVIRLWPLEDLADLASYGLVTMTSSSGPEVRMHPKGDLGQVLAGLQTLITVGLTGLLGFVLGNRIHK